jgi:hypothetical protein
LYYNLKTFSDRDDGKRTIVSATSRHKNFCSHKAFRFYTTVSTSKSTAVFFRLLKLSSRDL